MSAATVMLLCLLPFALGTQPSIVFTLDVSASMEYKDRLGVLGKALLHWFQDVPADVLLAMVTFSTEEELLSGLTTSRARLVEKIPTEGQGETCIGCGIRLALQVLGGHKNTGVMVLVTDGQNTEPGQDVMDVLDEVVASGTKVVAIGVGDVAPLDDLKIIAKSTGGLFFALEDGEGEIGLLEAFDKALAIAQWQVTTTTATSTTNTSTNKTKSLESTTVSTTLPRSRRKKSNQTSSNDPVGKYRHHGTPFWLIVGLTASAAGAILLVTVIALIVWRRIYATRLSGFYQVAYSDQGKT